MGDVAQQADGQPLDSSLGAADRHQVEQPLGRVLVGAVAGIDDRALDDAAPAGGACPGVGWRTTTTSAPIASMFLAVSMNDSPFERLEPLGGEVLGVGRQPLGRQAEAGPRPGRVFEEEVEDDPALQRGNLLAAARRDLGERLGGIQDRQDLLARQVFQTQQMLAAPGSRAVRRRGWETMRWSRLRAPLERDRAAAAAAILHDLLDRIDRMQPHPNVIAAVGRDDAGPRRRAGSGISR